MANIKVTSKKYSLNAQDFIKGAFLAVGGSVLTYLQTSIDSGNWEIHQKPIIMIALGSFFTYLLKNYFTSATIQKPISNAEVEATKEAVKAGTIDIAAKP